MEVQHFNSNINIIESIQSKIYDEFKEITNIGNFKFKVKPIFGRSKLETQLFRDAIKKKDHLFAEVIFNIAVERKQRMEKLHESIFQQHKENIEILLQLCNHREKLQSLQLTRTFTYVI